MTIPVRQQKNIWVAAGDGDLARVRVSCLSYLVSDSEQNIKKELVEQHCKCPLNS